MEQGDTLGWRHAIGPDPGGVVVAVAHMTRTAIISDIHGNLAGLEAVLRDAEAAGCGRIVCLGDLVEGGDANDEVVSLMRRCTDVCLRGNHDEEHDCVLSEASEAFLAACPTEVREGEVLFAHESPASPPGKVTNTIEAWRAMDACDARILVVGDAHVQGLYAWDDGLVGEARRVAFKMGVRRELEADRRYVVCPGAVGYGRDGAMSPRYALVDGALGDVEFREVAGPVIT